MSEIPEWLRILYACYLGKNKLRRLRAITIFITQYEGRKFFDQHSTPKDTILNFLKKVDDRGLKL